MAGDPRVSHPRLIQQFSQPDVKCLPCTRDIAARELKRRDTSLLSPPVSSNAADKGENANPKVWCRKRDIDNAGILPLTQ